VGRTTPEGGQTWTLNGFIAFRATSPSPTRTTTSPSTGTTATTTSRWRRRTTSTGSRPRSRIRSRRIRTCRACSSGTGTLGYTDNNVGDHPGQGEALPVDAHSPTFETTGRTVS
jgi:hypothetical protein